MGEGNWTTKSFVRYSTSMGRGVTSDGLISANYSNQEMFKARGIDSALDPRNVIRECCDSEEHPNTLPVILALDVTGSMGQTAVEVAKRLNEIMTKLYGQIKDVEFMIMGIGDLAYDNCPIQASQFESDIRIAEQLDKIYFEFGGGGNCFESYTAAWYFGSRHTKLDCWNRGKKGVIITIGDERLNPYLPVSGRRSGLGITTGDTLQADVETKDLYMETSEKFDIYHINVNHRNGYDREGIVESFSEYLDDNHFRTINRLDDIADEIVKIVVAAAENNIKNNTTENNKSNTTAITW